MKIYIDNHTSHYELENLTRLFFPNEKIEIVKEFKNSLMELPYIYTFLDTDNIIIKVNFADFAKEVKLSSANDNAEDERLMAVGLYKLLQSYTGITQPWGILTGVRPIKLMRRLCNSVGKDKAAQYFRDGLLVTDSKTDLALQTEAIERQIIELSQRKSFSLYVSIPFCPSRCNYCSFVSQSIEKAKYLIQPYTELLCKEIIHTAQIAKALDLKLETIYIGGGTPTTLSPEQMSMLITAIRDNFDMSACREFTVEAGRPDTINEAKLRTIIDNGVDRISINPQTLNDDVLSAIGRKHNAEQTITAYRLARQVGFKHINMDLIAGLPCDSFDSFKATLDSIIALDPESITVHTLSMKKSSFLTEKGLLVYKDDADRTSKMLDYCQDKLTDNGYLPYYLYRQSRMVGNLENVGWAKKGFEGLYNVYVMDETHTILACGAGAVTKLKQYGGEYLERIFNYKYPYEYIDGFDTLIKRKEAIYPFYQKYN